MKLVELSELGRTVTGKTPSSNNPEDFGDRYCFVTPTDSLQLKFIEKTDRSLSQLGADRLKGKLLPPKSVMVSCIGSAMGKVVMNKRPCVTNQQFNSIVVDQAHYSPDYVYYALKNNYRMLRNAATGSTALPLLNKTDFDRLKLRVHADKDEQVKVSSIFSALDAKIELNNRINAELEGLAKLLYDYWFVQFDFPMSAAQAAALGKPHLTGHPYRASGGKMIYNETLKREIPEGWKMSSVKDFAPVLTGKEDANHATQSGEFHFFTCGEQNLRCDDFKFDGKAVLVAGNGNFSVKFFEGRFNAYQRTYVLIPNDEAHFALIYFAIFDAIKGLAQGSQGSIIKFLTKGNIEDVALPLPAQSDKEVFWESINTILSNILVNQKQNQELTQLRDWLLPMLMNGQVTVG